MAEKKTEKKNGTRKASAKETIKVANKASKKVEQVAPKAVPEVEDVVAKKVVEEKRTRKDHRILWTAIITFFIATLLFGMAFFVFMNLEVISDDGLVKIEHGSIRVDSRKKKCSDDGEVDKNVMSEDGLDDEDLKGDKANGSEKGPREVIENPNARVTVKGAQLIEVDDFEFYLPKGFELAKGSDNGKYVYNLMDDDGWADVKVYTEKTGADVAAYIQKKDSLLRLTNSEYKINGTNWIEMESGSSIAYGTKLNGVIYVVIFNVKLESDVTNEAEQMIPKTIRLKRIYK